MLEVITFRGREKSRILLKIFKFFFSCIQHILLANDLNKVPASGLSLNCELTFRPYKALGMGWSWRKWYGREPFSIKMTFFGWEKATRAA